MIQNISRLALNVIRWCKEGEVEHGYSAKTLKCLGSKQKTHKASPTKHINFPILNIPLPLLTTTIRTSFSSVPCSIRCRARRPLPLLPLSSPPSVLTTAPSLLSNIRQSHSVLPHPLSSPLLQTPSRQINHTHSTLVRTSLHHHHYSAPCSEPNTHRCRARQTSLFPCTTTNNPSPHPLFSHHCHSSPPPSLPLPCSTNNPSRPPSPSALTAIANSLTPNQPHPLYSSQKHFYSSHRYSAPSSEPNTHRCRARRTRRPRSCACARGTTAPCCRCASARPVVCCSVVRDRDRVERKA